MDLECRKGGIPFVTFTKSTAYIFNTTAVAKYGLNEYEGICFSVSSNERIIKFEFIDEVDPMLRSIGYTKLSVKRRVNATAAGGARMERELHPIIRPREEEDRFVAYRCPLHEHKDSRSDSVVLYCDLNKSEEHIIKK